MIKRADEGKTFADDAGNIFEVVKGGLKIIQSPDGKNVGFVFRKDNPKYDQVIKNLARAQTAPLVVGPQAAQAASPDAVGPQAAQTTQDFKTPDETRTKYGLGITKKTVPKPFGPLRAYGLVRQHKRGGIPPLKTRLLAGHQNESGEEGSISDTAKIFGLLAGLQLGGEAVIASSPARREARQREEVLEARRRAGTLGRDPSADAAIRRELLDPARKIASESRKRRESQLAATGGTLSAADLKRGRKAEQDAINDMLKESSRQVNAERVRRKQQELAELQSLKEYRQQNIEGTVGRIMDTASAGAALYGQTQAAQAADERKIASFAAQLMSSGNMSADEAMKEARKIMGPVGSV
jgi:hypothetical protein